MSMPRAVLPLAALFLLSACATNDLGDSRGLTKTETGALIGAASGAVLGAIVKDDKRGKGAIIGAVGGGLAGGAVGYYMDRQAKDLELQLQPEIQRGEIGIVKRESDKALLVSMTSTTGFDNLSWQLKPAYLTTLDKDYFASQKVNPIRLQSYGRGETEPRADNATEAGRALNRRVELVIVPVVEG